MKFTSKEQLRPLLKGGIDKWSDTEVDRLLKFIDDRGDCWVWTGAKSKGYGRFSFRGATLWVPRLIARSKYHNTLEGLCSCHKCDNPQCLNPDHLFVGNNYDNVTDKVNKRRHAYGVKNGRAKLSENDVKAIRVWGKVYSKIMVAKVFGISESTIRRILKGGGWKHVTNETPTIRPRSGRTSADDHENTLHSCV